MHVAVRRIVGAEHLHALDDLDAGRVHRHEDLRLLLVRVRIGVGAHHDDHDLAARVAGARGVELRAVDDVLVAVGHGRGLDLLGVAGHDARLGHHVGGADLAVRAAAPATSPSAPGCRRARALPCCRCRVPSS